MAKSAYQLWQEEQARKQQEAADNAASGQINYKEAAKTSRVQYTTPNYQGKSKDKSYKWEESLSDLKFKGARSNNDKFKAWAKVMGLTDGQAEDFRNYLDFGEDSKAPGPNVKKDGTVDQRSSVPLGQGATTQVDRIDAILNGMKKNMQTSMDYQNKLAAEKAATPAPEQQQSEPYQKTGNKFVDGVLKALEIVDRPGDAVRSGIKNKMEGNSFWQGAKEGFTGKMNTSGSELNKKFGFDPTTDSKDAAIAKVLGDLGIGGSGAIANIASSFMTDEMKKKLGTEIAGLGPELLLDPLNLIGTGLGTKIAKNLGKGADAVRGAEEAAATARAAETAQQAADPLDFAGRTFQREASGAIIDGNAPQLNAPADEVIRQLTGKVDNAPTEPLGLNEPMRIRNVDGLGKEVNVEGTPQLNAPETPNPDPLGRGQDYWQGRYEDFAKAIQDAGYNPNNLGPDAIQELWTQFARTDEPLHINQVVDLAYPKDGQFGDPLPFKQSKLFNVVEDFLNYVGRMDPKDQAAVRSDSSFSTRYHESPQGDTLKINPEQPLQFKTQAEGRPFKTTVQKEVTRKDPVEILNDLKNVKNSQDAQRVVDDLIRNGAPSSSTISPEIIAKHLNPDGSFKDVSGEALNRMPIEERLKWQSERQAIRKAQEDGTLNQSPPSQAAEEIAAAQGTPETSSNMDPLGIRAGQGRQPEISYIDEPKGILDKIRSGDVSLKSLTHSAKTHISSDLQFVKDAMRQIAEQDMGQTLQMMGRKMKDVAYGDNLLKQLRGVRRSISEAMKASKEDYGGILKSLKQNKISRRDFNEYAANVHFRDIMTHNMDKAVRHGEVMQRLQDIEQAAKVEKDPKILKQLADEEKALLKEKDTLDPYELPAGVTEQSVKHVLDRWKNTSAMKNAHTEFIKAQRKDLQMQVDSGLLSYAQADAMIQAHPNYIYMGRAKETDSLFGRNGNISKPNKHIKARQNGSDEKLKYAPLESAVQNRMLTYHNVRRNNAMQTIVKLAQAKGGDEFFTKVNTDFGNAIPPNVVKFFEDGKATYYEVPPLMKHAFDNLDSKAAENLAAKMAQAAANVIRKGGTYYNLDFIFSSPLRETNALVTSRTGMHPGHLALGYLDSFFGKGLEKISGGKFKSYRDAYEELGGHQTGIVTQDPQSLREFTKAMDKGTLGKGIEIINPLHWISELGGKVEHGPKLGEFRSAKGKGYSNLDAMHEATDVIDYTDAGTTTRSLNRYIPFLNPMIRGTTRYFQAAKENPAGWAMKNFAYVTAPTLAIYGMRFAPWATDEQRSKIRNMSGWKKNMFWAIPAPDGESVWTVPKMHVGAQLFANPVERLLDKYTEEDPKAWSRIAKDTGMDLGNVLTPPNSIAGLQLIMDSMANYNRLMDMPIEDSTMQREVDKTKRYNAYTSEVAKGLGKTTGQSPAKIDYLLKGLTAGTGRDALDLMDNTLAATGVDRPRKVDTVLDILDPTARFRLKDTDSTGTYNRLYEQQQRDGSGSEAKALYDQMKDLNKQIKAIREDKEMSSADKKKAIAELRAQQRAVGDEAISSGILKNR